MAKSKKKKASKDPDIMTSFATPEQAALFCYALERLFREKLLEDSSKLNVRISGQEVCISAPSCHFDKIKELSCNPQYNRKTYRQITATSR